MDRYEISEVNLGKRVHLFWSFWCLSFKFFFKRGNHEEHPQSKHGWISALHNSLLYTRVRYLFWQCRNFNLAFMFFRTFEAIASPLNLESSWQPRYSTVLCCLMEWPAKDILISLEPLVFEKSMDLVLSSPKWIDSLLFMNH